jgi:hypothetical protein
VQSALGHEKASTTLDVDGHLWADDDDRIRAAVGASRVTLASRGDRARLARWANAEIGYL